MSTLCTNGHTYIHIYVGGEIIDWFCSGYDYVDDYGTCHYVLCDAPESLPTPICLHDFADVESLNGDCVWGCQTYGSYTWTDGTF